jgi:hypothetical protein
VVEVLHVAVDHGADLGVAAVSERQA